jgi:hypothetical protein
VVVTAFAGAGLELPAWRGGAATDVQAASTADRAVPATAHHITPAPGRRGLKKSSPLGQAPPPDRVPRLRKCGTCGNVPAPQPASINPDCRKREATGKSSRAVNTRPCAGTIPVMPARRGSQNGADVGPPDSRASTGSVKCGRAP